MIQAFPIACYRSQIAGITASIYDTMLHLRVRPVDGVAGEYAGEFTAAIYYAGAWQGALLLECSAEQAIDWTSRLMSLDPPVSLDDARDGLGELTNVIAGNLKPVLPPGIGISMPSVVQGSDYRLRVCGGNLFERLEFADHTGRFRVTLVEVVEEG
ncbi:MAG: chemotaxis protein CheX [Candidatus Sulfopaludibacter sp.]|nr:chemotaxis protein CheX [Candidatus Sulfopaludibacter sp.]